jgi:MYXO-CTERM domain-containing protein
MPTEPTSTIIRNNVFIKNDDPSPDGDRPNVLFGGFPDTGPGSTDRYEIYGNVFFHNPRESLLQASGRVTVHDNLFVDVRGTAVLLQNHDLPLKLAYVYNNTVFGAGTGISFGSSAGQGDAVVGNLVFAATAIRGSIQNQKDNLIDTTANAASYVKTPSIQLGAMDFYPLPGKCQGTPLDLAIMSEDVDYAVDFNGTSKGEFKFRGAYAGEGTNPGWLIGDGLKSGGPMRDGGVVQGSGGVSGSVDAGGGIAGAGGSPAGAGGAAGGADGFGDSGSSAANGSGGCGCRVGAPPARRDAFAALLLLAVVARRRSRATTTD